MNDKKKQLNQIIILTALLVVLGIVMFKTFASTSKSTSKAKATEKARAEAEAPKGPTTRVTPMGQIITEGAVTTSSQAEKLGLIGALNPNVTKVHEIRSARNPFNREPSWFDSELDKIPGKGLPEGFLDEMSEEVPDLNKLFNTDEEFVSYSMEKNMAEDAYKYSATSEDGRITTTIQARTKTDPTIRVEYTEQSGRELTETPQPGASDTGLPSIGNPFGTNPWTEGPAPNQVRPPNGKDAKDNQYVVCTGVSIKGDSKSALLQLPDGSRLVREGDVLMPGNLKVVRISESGVEIRDIRSGEQLLIPLSSEI